MNWDGLSASYSTREEKLIKPLVDARDRKALYLVHELKSLLDATVRE